MNLFPDLIQDNENSFQMQLSFDSKRLSIRRVSAQKHGTLINFSHDGVLNEFLSRQSRGPLKRKKRVFGDRRAFR